MQKVLITGSAGFLGSHLAEGLLDLGYSVVGIDNLFRGRKEYLPNNKNFTFYRLDLTHETDQLVKIMEKERPDIVIHYAAINGTKYFYDIPYQVLNFNIKMTLNLLNAIKEVKLSLESIVYASSSEVYGESPLKIPTPEDHPIILDILAERDSYAASKAIGEFYVKLFCKKYGIKFLIYRIFNTYGPRMDTSEYGQVIPEFIRKAFFEDEFTIIGDGTQTRSFCYVSDHVRIALELMQKASNEVINVGSDEEIRIYDLAEKICEIVGKEFKPKFLEPRKNDPKQRRPDISKLKKYTKPPKISLDEGLRRTISWYASKWGVKL